MHEYLTVLNQSALFSELNDAEIIAILRCLSAIKKEYAKNQFILHRGNTVHAIGMVLSGSVSVIREDFWGNRNILAKIEPSQIFAETYACMKDVPLNVSVIADENTTILLLNAQRILTTCSAACAFHSGLIRNFVSALAGKNLIMNEKLVHLTQRSTRDKLLSYLSAEAQRQGGASLNIAFNRQQLADFLSVDRSAMSSELGKMRDEGLLTFNKNHFELKMPL